MTLWAKKFSWFFQNCILLSRGTFEQNNSQSRRFGFFCSPCQILQAWVAETVFHVSRGVFCGIFFLESYYLALWAKKFSWFCQNCILLFRGTFEQNSSPLLFLARFFKHGLPKLYSTCPEEIFAEFSSQNHISWHCERKNSARFVRTAFYFSGELLSKTILKVVDLVFFVVLARFFKHGLPKLYSTCPEAFFAEFFS